MRYFIRNLYSKIIVCVKLNTIRKKRNKKYCLTSLIQRAGLSEIRSTKSGANSQSRARKHARGTVYIFRHNRPIGTPKLLFKLLFKAIPLNNLTSESSDTFNIKTLKDAKRQ